VVRGVVDSPLNVVVLGGLVIVELDCEGVNLNEENYLVFIVRDWGGRSLSDNWYYILGAFPIERLVIQCENGSEETMSRFC
jgi:hypothetical protein